MNTTPGPMSISRLITVLCILLLALVIFWAGTAVGSHQAKFSRDWEDNYAHQFGGPGSPFGMPSGDGDSMASAHGAFGQVIGVRMPEIMIKGPQESEKTVIVNSGTIIRMYRSPATTTDIVPGMTVMVIGDPDDQGDIQASLIRIVPAEITGSSTTITNTAK